VIETGKRKEGL